MNIAILVPSLKCGGAERSVVYLANILISNSNYNVNLYVLEKSEVYYNLNDQVNLEFIDHNIKKSNFFSRNIRRVYYLRNHLRKNKIDVIIGFTYLSAIISSIACLFTNIKCIVSERSDPRQYNSRLRFLKKILYRTVEGAVFQTDYIQEYYKTTIPNSVIIPNMIDSEHLPEYVPFCERKNKIISVGRLDKMKNHKLLIDAISNIKNYLNDYIVEIYGEGDLKSELQSQIDTLKINNLVFLKGNTNQVYEKMKDSKVFIFTSKIEGFPNVLLEAAALGIPCVVLDTPSYAHHELLKNDVYSIIVKENCEKKIATAIKQIIDIKVDDKKMHEHMNWIRCMYSNKEIGRKWLEYVDKV